MRAPTTKDFSFADPEVGEVGEGLRVGKYWVPSQRGFPLPSAPLPPPHKEVSAESGT